MSPKTSPRHFRQGTSWLVFGATALLAIACNPSDGGGERSATGVKPVDEDIGIVIWAKVFNVDGAPANGIDLYCRIYSANGDQEIVRGYVWENRFHCPAVNAGQQVEIVKSFPTDTVVATTTITQAQAEDLLASGRGQEVAGLLGQDAPPDGVSMAYYQLPDVYLPDEACGIHQSRHTQSV